MTDPLSTPAHELAQVNIGRLQFPLDSPELKDFVDALDPVNAVADAAEGFEWRLQSDTGNATDVPVLGDDWLIINMSVWRDPNALTAFMYQGQHRELLARRREWFERMREAMTVLWWVPALPPPHGGGGGGTASTPAGTWADAVRVHVADVVRADKSRGQQVPRRGLTSLLTGSLIRPRRM